VFNKSLIDRYFINFFNFDKLCIFIKEFSRPFTCKCKLFRYFTQSLLKKSKLVIIFFIFSFLFVGLKQKFVSNHFVNHARKAPDIRVVLIFTFNNSFRASVLSGLNSVSEMFLPPARVTEINDLDSQFFIQAHNYIIFPDQVVKIFFRVAVFPLFFFFFYLLNFLGHLIIFLNFFFFFNDLFFILGLFLFSFFKLFFFKFFFFVLFFIFLRISTFFYFG
jgi:hypothetical protein